MLQNIKLPRPDRLLQKRLIRLAYSLVALTISLILFIVCVILAVKVWRLEKKLK